MTAFHRAVALSVNSMVRFSGASGFVVCSATMTSKYSTASGTVYSPSSFAVVTATRIVSPGKSCGMTICPAPSPAKTQALQGVCAVPMTFSAEAYEVL